MEVKLINKENDSEIFDPTYRFQIDVGMELLYMKNIDKSVCENFGRALIEMMKLELENKNI